VLNGAINTRFDPDAVLVYANDTAADSNSNAKSNVKSSTTAANNDGSAVTSLATSLSASKLPTLHLPRMNSSMLDIHGDGFADDSALDEHDTTGKNTATTARNCSTLLRRQMVQQLFEAIDACDAMRVREMLHRGCEVNTVWLPQSTTAVIDDATNAR
jgi:hypothetical protein